METPQDNAKKHSCKDCFYCQWCSDERCRVCRRDVHDCKADHQEHDLHQGSEEA